MVELRKHEKEEKALRREQVSEHLYLNITIQFLNYLNTLRFVFVLFSI